MRMDDIAFHGELPSNIPTMVVAFGGWVDAGEAATSALRSLVVRLRWRLISTVEVCARVCHTSVAEGNCVTARWGGEQPEAKPRSAGGRTRFGEMSRRACNEVAKSETHGARCRGGQSDAPGHHVVGGGTRGRSGAGRGETCEGR